MVSALVQHLHSFHSSFSPLVNRSTDNNLLLKYELNDELVNVLTHLLIF
jgi:hypothetical protein